MESFAQFSVDGSRLYGMVHTPDADAPASGWPSVVFVHGFTGNRIEAQRLFVRFSRRLAAQGIASLRFDCRGSGESHGEFSDVTVGTEVQDTLAAVTYLRRQPGIDPLRVMLLGFSMGGLVATLAAPDALAHRLLLWAPALPDAWLPRLPGGQMPATVADLGGWPVGRAFYQDMLRQRPLDVAARWGGVAHVLHGDADEVCPPEYGVRYARALGCDATAIPGGTHTFASLDTTEMLYQESLTFLRGG
ncbi:alpha/beta fold hydrolase [Deinococcus sp. KSM4-11]|uniref:alpha/beta hydrolase family protein n=1 Tax=Deinococcus sp. KSM4-11 TaxID=2568654 RepID=UPI0010A3EA1B|nr:alpha/beta fold hydrolase [Deinococcus sp. KSM4-11]THF88751.1 alpha/beta fold hydrolase [Deinococcus sp. KSM4-11]